MALFILVWSMKAKAFHASFAVKRDTTHTRTHTQAHSHMHNLLVTHAKYVENETTCLGTRTRQAMVMATLSGQSYSDDTEQNCHQIYERQGEKERERVGERGRDKGSETHTNTLLIVGTANGSLELALTVKQVDTMVEGRRGREVAYYTRFVYIVCIPFQFRSPLLLCFPSSLFNSPFLFALLSSCLCCCKFAWLQFSFWFFLRLLWRRARHSKLCSFNLLTPCRLGCMGVYGDDLASSFEKLQVEV